MIAVASKELRNRLGRYLSLVQKGDTVQVTSRGKPVACLVPAGDDLPAAARALAQVASKGALRLGTGRLKPRRRAVPLRPGKLVEETIADQRR